MTDTEGKLKFVSGLSVKKLGPPTCSAGQSGFRHISVLPFVSMGGQVSKPYVTMSGQASMHAWRKVWPEALFGVSERGAVTTELFAQ